jgi:hypothetical protein
MRAEVVRDGQTRSQMKRVAVESGKPVNVDFNDLAAVQAASR